MNKFVYEKLVPILYRKDPHIRLKTEPPKSMYDEVVESIVNEMLDPEELAGGYFSGLGKEFTVVPAGFRTDSEDDFRLMNKLSALGGRIKTKPDTYAIHKILWRGKEVGEFTYDVLEWPDHAERVKHDETWLNWSNQNNPYTPEEYPDFYDWLDNQPTIKDLPEPKQTTPVGNRNFVRIGSPEWEAHIAAIIDRAEAEDEANPQERVPMPDHIRQELLARMRAEQNQ